MAKELNFKQELTAVFGQPVAENPTQAMVEPAYRHHDLDWRYLTIEVAPDDLEAAVQGARVMGFRGFNLTIPHKVAVMEYLDEIGESASLIGAVNCVVRRGEKLVGENTDGKGFLESLKERTDPKGKRITMLGAGGAARAIGTEVALAGAASIRVINRSEERGKALVERLKEKTGVDAEFAPWSEEIAPGKGCDVLINATSIGLYPDTSAPPVEFGEVDPKTIVADVIPNPPRTRFLEAAEARGCEIIDGLGMLVNQGRIGITYWSGVDPDTSVMRGALEELFGTS